MIEVEMAPRLTLSVAEVALMLGVGQSTVYDSIRRGDFPVPVTRVGARLLVSRAALLELLSVGSTDVSEAA